jgi:hypothetical protein
MRAQIALARARSAESEPDRACHAQCEREAARRRHIHHVELRAALGLEARVIVRLQVQPTVRGCPRRLPAPAQKWIDLTPSGEYVVSCRFKQGTRCNFRGCASCAYIRIYTLA